MFHAERIYNQQFYDDIQLTFDQQENLDISPKPISKLYDLL